MPHDCWYCKFNRWYCKFNRWLLVVGLLAMSLICLVGSIDSLFHRHWRASAAEFFCTFIPLGMIWVGLKVLRAIPIAFDKLWPDDDETQ